jgi:hypothetical protein
VELLWPPVGKRDLRPPRDHDELVVDLIIGRRGLRDVDYYRDDEMLKWALVGPRCQRIRSGRFERLTN